MKQIIPFQKEIPFKTKVSEMYWAYVDVNYLIPDRSYFNNKNKIHVNSGDTNYINIIDNLYTTGSKININSTNEDPKEIRSQKINLFINGEIPAWVFKEVLPLTVKVGTETHYRFIKPDNTIYLDKTGTDDDLQIIGINDKPNIKNVLFPEINMNGYTGSSIDLSDISNGTAVANADTFDRMFIGNNKVFFVNKVTLLERFKERINIEGVFQYYKDDPTKPKNCVYSDIIYVDDWALKLPECYEGCEIDEDDATQLVMKFGTYEQFESDAYLLKNVVNENNLYLDISMSTIDASNITKIDLILDKMKYFFSNESDRTLSFFENIRSLNIIYILFNDNGFIKTKSFNYNNLHDNFSNIINNCYIIEGDIRLENSVRMIKPLKNIFKEYNDKQCIVLKYTIYCDTDLTIIENLFTNTFNNDKFHDINLLVSGEIPTKIMDYMPLPIKLNYVTYDENYGYIFELSKDKTNIKHGITSVNALPTPDGDVGIDNSDPNDQCTLNLENLINPPEEDP